MLVDTFQHRLKQAMEDAGLKQVDLVKKTNLDKSLINKYLSGISNARQKKLTLLASTLNVSEVWLMGYDVPRNSSSFCSDISENFSTAIPLLKSLQNNQEIFESNNIIGTVDISCQLSQTGDFIALMMEDDSMAHSFLPNDILIMKRQQNFESNDFVIVSVGEKKAVLRKIKKTSTGILLQCLNSSYEPSFYTYEEMDSIPVTVWGVLKELKRNF